MSLVSHRSRAIQLQHTVRASGAAVPSSVTFLFTHNIMGEPLIGSLICGAVALVMVGWNWHMLHNQRRRGKRAAKLAAQAARERLSARANERNFALAQFEALPSCSRTNLAPLINMDDCPAKDSLSVRVERDRAETSPISPAGTSSRTSQEGFFKDGSVHLSCQQRICCRVILIYLAVQTHVGQQQ